MDQLLWKYTSLLLFVIVCTGIGSNSECEGCYKCPESTLCKCERDTTTGMTNVYCDGYGFRQSIFNETLPESVNRLTVSNFLFQNLSKDTFPASLRVKKFVAKENDIWNIDENTFSQFRCLDEVSISDCTIKIYHKYLKQLAVWMATLILIYLSEI